MDERSEKVLMGLKVQNGLKVFKRLKGSKECNLWSKWLELFEGV